MTTLIFFIGLALVVAGIAQLTIPGAFVAAGIGLAAIAVTVERSARANIGGDA